MTALATIRAAGLTLRAEGDRLFVEPKDRLTDDLRDYIRTHKPDILRALSAYEVRSRKVATTLRADPALKYAYDVQGTSPMGKPAASVSVVLGLRDSSGTIVTGELIVPAEHWDMGVFIGYWDAQGRPS